MLRRVQCTFPRTNWLVVVPAAIALASCGGSIGGDGVTGVSVDEMAVEAAAVEAAVVEAASSSDKVLVCHRGANLWVPRSALNGHLNHGDAFDGCDSGVTCPCFSADEIQGAAAVCDASLAATCSTGDPYYLALSCDLGGNQNPEILGVFLSQTADGGYCSRDDVFGSFSKDGLSDAQYEACVSAINNSGYCL